MGGSGRSRANKFLYAPALPPPSVWALKPPSWALVHKTTYATMNYTALCIMFWKRAYPLFHHIPSVEHAAVSKLMEFFNFGPIMTGMVMTLLNGRKARVIMEGGYSEDILIKRSTPQGDRASPYIFIIVIEVLLINLNPHTVLLIHNPYWL
jgi:hypothetical protein